MAHVTATQERPDGVSTTNGTAALAPVAGSGFTTAEVYRQLTDNPEFRASYAAHDTVPPQVKLLQKMRNQARPFDDIPDGHFVHLITGQDLGERLRVLVLLSLQSRLLYEGEYDGSPRAAVCYSHDAARGHGEPGGACGGCPFTRASKDAEGKRRSARCTLTHSYVLLPVAFADGVEDDAHLGPDLTGGGVFLFGMQRGALPAAQAWNTMLGDRKNPGFTVVYDLAVSKRSGPGGAIYTPVARPVHRIFDPRALEALEGYRHEAFEQREAILTYLTRSDSVAEPEPAPVDLVPAAPAAVAS